MKIQRGAEVKWRQGQSLIKGTVEQIYANANKAIKKMNKAFLIRLEDGKKVLKFEHELVLEST